MRQHSRGTATRLHPDVARLVRQAGCWRITTAYLIIGFTIVVILALRG